MNNNIKYRLNAALVPVIVILLFSRILNAATYNGYWLDNGTEVTRIGNLEVTDNSITIENKVSYSVTLDSKDGDVNIYKVNKASTKTDPLGCGPDSRANYIIIRPLPDIAGTRQKAIWLIFYGRSTPPIMKKINSDPGVCAVFSFGRNPE